MSPSSSGILSRKPRRATSPAALRAKQAEKKLPPQPSSYFVRKGYFDRTIAVVLLIPGLPIIAALAALTRLTSRGPAIYRQVRVGQGGRKFMMYKIRTMRHDAEADSGPVWSNQARDPRVTPVGRVLRRLHLDELPQLWNILKGEMSLVGPRPERPEFVHVLADAIPNYRCRLAAPPGITGLAQLNLPPDTDLVAVQRKLELDLEYIEQASLLFDIRLLVCTFLRIFKLPERWLLPLFRLHRTPKTPPPSSVKPLYGLAHATVTPTHVLAQTVLDTIRHDGAEAERRAEQPPSNGNGRPKPR